MKKSDGVCGVDSEQKHEMRTPGLVARLMGLEAMPAVQRDKLKKNSLSASENNSKGGKFGKQDLVMEKGESKHELRPQKLQKTGITERRPVTRFGTEALQLKNVLSRSRKHQQPKLTSPVKSPRNLSGKNASRLIGAATRILEPGLQRSRSKCALTYSGVVNHHAPASENLKQLENSDYFICGGGSAAQSSSCRNCAQLLVEQPANFSPMSKNACFSSGQVGGDPRVTIVCPMRENGKDQETSPIHPSLAMDGGEESCFGHTMESRPLNSGGQRQWQATSPQRKLHRDVCPSICLKQKDRVPIKPKLSRPQSSRVSAAANETRNYIAMNRNLNNHGRLTIPAKMDNYQLHHADRKIGESRHDSLSPVRKKRSMTIARQNECTGFVNSTFLKSTNARSIVMPVKGTNRLLHLQEEGRNGESMKNEAGVVSFTFNSQMKRKTGIHTAEVEEKRKQNGTNCEIPVEKSVLVRNDGKRTSLKPCSINGDSLGALLEQKLRELSCQEEDESTFGDTTVPKKTTAMILQELISALTTERPFQEDLTSKLKNQKSRLCADDPRADMSYSTGLQSSQVGSKSSKNLVGNVQDYEHQSPGSVLEACFSNDSCASSSLDDGSRHNPCAELCNERHSFEPDVDLLDSATSLSMGRLYRESVITLLENISEVFSKINPDEVLLKGSKLTHAKEVILNTDMVFGNAAALQRGGFSISLFVLNELETLASVMAAKNFSSGSDDTTKGGKEHKGFIFDCVIEYLDSRFSRYSNSGFNVWMRLPLRMKTELLIGDIVEEVGRWTELAGLIPDELIYYEMSHSLGKWIDFELEAFETGAEIEVEILQALIDELVIDTLSLLAPNPNNNNN